MFEELTTHPPTTHTTHTTKKKGKGKTKQPRRNEPPTPTRQSPPKLKVMVPLETALLTCLELLVVWVDCSCCWSLRDAETDRR